jgi:predicted nucleic acid-binding Zn ribbon protein
MNDFAQDFYWRMREAVTGRLSRDAKRRNENAQRAQSRPFEKGRDPVTVSSSIDSLLQAFNWDSQLGEAELFANWPKLVGDKNAENAVPEALVNSTLTVRCKSTAWATQLRLLHDQFLEKITAEYPSVGVTKIKFLGPDAPSWKKGQRSIPGRGPRDTYG